MSVLRRFRLPAVLPLFTRITKIEAGNNKVPVIWGKPGPAGRETLQAQGIR